MQPGGPQEGWLLSTPRGFHHRSASIPATPRGASHPSHDRHRNSSERAACQFITLRMISSVRSPPSLAHARPRSDPAARQCRCA